jgi:FkbM family methyltransferase
MYKEVIGRWGPCKFLAKDEYVGRSMYYYGEYNPDETEKILGLAKGLCLDIGANIGVISQALLVSGFDVIAFEPQPELFKLLEYNCSKATCINAAVGDKSGTAHMPKVHYSAKGNFGGLGIGTPSIYGNITVPVNTIDSMKLDVGFMKIDVEGYEYEVLCGATETINRCKPIMYIEDDRGDKSRALRQKIEQLGYEIEEHQPPLYRENNFFGLKKNVWDRNYASHNLIAKPLL